MKLGTKLLFATPIVVVILLMTTVASTAYAWDWGGVSCGWGSCNHYGNYGCEGCNGGGVGLGHLITGLGQNFGLWSGGEGGAYQNGIYAGTQDAIYDHQNNLVYSDQPSCLSCHSQSYLDGFRSGYDQQWNSYQNQESTQGISNNVNVENSPGSIVTIRNGQSSEQGQDGGGP